MIFAAFQRHKARQNPHNKKPLRDHVLILKNHGLLSCGKSIPEAFIMMYYLEQACRIQIAAQAGNKVTLPLPQVQELAHKQAMKGFGTALGVMEFTALKRRLDRLGSDYAN